MTRYEDLNYLKIAIIFGVLAIVLCIVLLFMLNDVPVVYKYQRQAYILNFNETVEVIRNDMESNAVDEFCNSKGYTRGYDAGGPGHTSLYIHCYQHVPGGTRDANYPYEEYKAWLSE